MRDIKRNMNLLIVALITFIPVSALAQVVVSQPGAQQNWWQFLLNNLLTVVFTIITPVLSYLIWKLLAKWKINLELSAIDSITSKAISCGEEAAHKALKGNLPLTNGADKMKVAVSIANTLIDQYKLPQMAEETLIKLIESKLGESRDNTLISAPMIGATNGSTIPNKL